MPTLQRYSISSPAPVAPLDNSQATVAEAASELAINLSKMADRVAVETGVPVARDKGAEEGADLGWKPKGGIGEVAAAYDEAARRANDDAIQNRLSEEAQRIQTELADQPDSFSKFPALYAGATTELLKVVSPERRQYAMTMRQQIAGASVEKLRGRATQIAADHVAGQYLNNLEKFSRDAANLAGSSDPNDQARLRDVERQFNEAVYYAAGQPIGADGKPVPVDSVLGIARDKEGRPINPFADGKVVLKTGAVIPYAKLADIKQKFADGQYEAATLRAFEAAMSRGTGTSFISAFRGSTDIPLSQDDKRALERSMFSRIRQARVEEARAARDLDKGMKADYEAEVSKARAALMNPEAFPDMKVTVDTYRDLAANAHLSPNAFDEFTTAWKVHSGGRDDDAGVADVRAKLRAFNPDGADDAMDTLKLNGKLSPETATSLEREIASVREQVDNGPLVAPVVKPIMDMFESRLKAKVLGPLAQSKRGRSTVPDVIVDETRARIQSELSQLTPDKWAQRAGEITTEALIAAPTRELLAALTVNGAAPDAPKYEPSLPLPAGANDFIRALEGGNMAYFDTGSYAETTDHLRETGVLSEAEANRRLAAAARWEAIQIANPAMGTALKAAKQAASMRIEARKQQKLGNPLPKELSTALAGTRW